MMKTNVLLCILLLVCSINIYATGSKENREVELNQTYTGMVSFGYDPESGGIQSCTAPMIINTEESYESFIVMIPEFEMTPINPAPPNDDPLLQRPQIDFDTHMMLVIFSYDPNIFINLKIDKVEISGNEMIVHTWYEEPNPDAIVSKIIDYGFYYAVVVEAFDGEIRFR